MAKSRISKLVEPYVITKGRRFRLKDVDPGDTAGFDPEKEIAEAALAEGVTRLRLLQEKLYAQNSWGVLLIFQAMDAAGKGGAVEHVMSGVNPAGVEVYSFKAPSSEERDHDFMWRSYRRLPERGRVGIFDRSYYEEVLVVRVHPEFLEGSQIPRRLLTRQSGTSVSRTFAPSNAISRARAMSSAILPACARGTIEAALALDESDKNWKIQHR